MRHNTMLRAILPNPTLFAIVRQNSNIQAVAFHVTHKIFRLHTVTRRARTIACKRDEARDFFVGHSNIIAKTPAVNLQHDGGFQLALKKPYGIKRNLM
jgi:hypothetical protein